MSSIPSDVARNSGTPPIDNNRERVFRDWLSAPIDGRSPDPRFEIRRATPDDFGRVFDLVDSVFKATRKRSVYQWLYLGNPVGIARCWLVIERRTGEVVSSEARLPWPVARDTELLEGEFVADSVVVPRLQRQGVFRLKAAAREAHPWSNRTIALSAPNERSIGALAKMGRQHTVLGPLPCASLLLDSARYLRSRSWPRAIAGTVGGAADLALRSLQAMCLTAPPNVRIEHISRFDSGVDALTFECGNASGYWCPHGSEFLNWRYFDNPGNSYMAQAAVVNQRLAGYSVVRLGRQQATLMEFSVSPAMEFSAGALLGATAAAAREAGCMSINFYSTATWCFWNLLYRAGFLRRKARIYRTARCPDRPDASREDNWRLMPGDSDVH